MTRALRIAGYSLLALLAASALAVAVPMLFFTSAHTAIPHRPFAGSNLCHPYGASNGSIATRAPGPHWFRANFHAHSNVWEGKQSPCDVVAAYRAKGFEVVEVSDHGAITDTSACNDAFIPTYEHGANVRSVHFLAINARKKVAEKFLWPRIPQMLDTIDRLKASSDFVVINHPCHNAGFAPSDFRTLDGYDAVDVEGKYCKSRVFWDEALSSGIPAWCFAGDDMHDVSNRWTGTRYVYLHADSTRPDDVVKALRSGSYLCNFRLDDATSDDVPFPTLLTASNGSISVELFTTARSLRWIGEQGALLREDHDVRSASFAMGEHAYVRIEAETASQRAYFQPVRRCE